MTIVYTGLSAHHQSQTKKHSASYKISCHKTIGNLGQIIFTGDRNFLNRTTELLMDLVWEKSSWNSIHFEKRENTTIRYAKIYIFLNTVLSLVIAL